MNKWLKEIDSDDDLDDSDDMLDNMENCSGCYKHLRDGEGVFVKDYNETFCGRKCMVTWALKYDFDEDEFDDDFEEPVEAPDEAPNEAPVEEPVDEGYDWSCCPMCQGIFTVEYENTRIGSVCSRSCYFNALDQIDEMRQEAREERRYQCRRKGGRR
jgi:hypothetical protein